MTSGTSRRSVAHTHDVVTLATREDIASATRRAIHLLGSMESILAGRKKVILKPNFVAGRPSRTGATRRLLRYGDCPEGAISVKGMSGATPATMPIAAVQAR